MIFLITQVIFAGQPIAVTAVPTTYTNKVECYKYVDAASAAYRDDMSNKLVLVSTCKTAKELFSKQ